MTRSTAATYALDRDEVARMEKAAAEGRLEKVDTWAAGVFDDLQKRYPDHQPWPDSVVSTLCDLHEVATVVDMARRGQEQELRDYMALMVLDLDGASPEQRQVLHARMDKMVSTLREQGVAPAGDLTAEPAWARDEPDASSPEHDRLVIRMHVRSLLHRRPAVYTFDATPRMFVMRGELGRVRVPRQGVIKLRWLAWAPGGGVTPLNRVLFVGHEDRIEGYFDLMVYVHSKKVVKWLAGHGYPVEKIAGGKALDDLGAVLRRQHV